jgi:CMP-N-acetylneuraminic acid synthetase
MKKNKKLNSISFNYKKRERSQDMNKVYLENGAIFIFKKEGFLKFKNRIFGKFDYYEMNKNKSIDIDSIQDLNKAQNYFR